MIIRYNPANDTLQFIDDKNERLLMTFFHFLERAMSEEGLLDVDLEMKK